MGMKKIQGIINLIIWGKIKFPPHWDRRQGLFTEFIFLNLFIVSHSTYSNVNKTKMYHSVIVFGANICVTLLESKTRTLWHYILYFLSTFTIYVFIPKHYTLAFFAWIFLSLYIYIYTYMYWTYVYNGIYMGYKCNIYFWTYKWNKYINGIMHCLFFCVWFLLLKHYICEIYPYCVN